MRLSSFSLSLPAWCCFLLPNITTRNNYCSQALFVAPCFRSLRVTKMPSQRSVVTTTMALNGDDDSVTTGSNIADNTSTTSSPMEEQPYSWRVFPAHQWETLQERHGKQNVKLVHLVRHAEGTHNVGEPTPDYKSRGQIDARLTEAGHAQCQALAARIPMLLQKDETTCILTSTLTRCIQTALYSIPHDYLLQHVAGTCNVEAHEAFRETVNYQCDRRRPLDEIRREFQLHFPDRNVKFEEEYCGAHNHDAIWDEYRQRLGEDWDSHMESAELYRVADRGFVGLQALERRPESQIVVCTHSAFLRCILNWGQEGGVPKLMPQLQLDDRAGTTATCTTSTNNNNNNNSSSNNNKLFEYAKNTMVTHPDHGHELSFEDYMRGDFENCELRSFCMLVRPPSSYY